MAAPRISKTNSSASFCPARPLGASARPTTFAGARCRLAAIAIVVTAAASGCGSVTRTLAPWSTYEAPPTVQGEFGPSARDVAEARSVVVGLFEEPVYSSVAGWDRIGPRLSDALARTLLNHGNVSVIVNPRLARDVQNLRNLGDAARRTQLTALQQGHPDVRLVINGRVADFQHTNDLHPSVRRQSAFGRRTREAIVSLQLDVFDLRLGRSVGSDHVFGTSSTPKTSAEELYANVALDSYVFWSTPLGRASKKAVLEAVDELDIMVPASRDRLVITDHDAGRRSVTVAITSGRPVRKDEQFHLYAADAAEGDGPMIDPHMDLPSVAVIDSDGRSTVTAFLYGPPPRSVDLRGMVLRPVPRDERRTLPGR